MATVRAKFKLESVMHTVGSREVTLTPVYSNVPESENKSFWDATPSGTIKMWITNKSAWPAFENLGQEFYVDFTPA